MSAEKIISADSIYHLMVAVQAQLQQVLKREEPITRAELEQYIKAVRAQAVPVHDPVKLAQQLLPQLVAQLPKQLPMNVTAPSERIVELLSPVVNQQVAAIQTTNGRVLREMGLYIVKLEALLEKARKANVDSEERYGALLAKIPKTVSVNLGQGWRRVLAIIMGTMAFVLLTLALSGKFSKEVESYNILVRNYKKLYAEHAALRKQRTQQQQRLSVLEKERNAYRTEVSAYRKRFPKARISTLR